MSVGIAIKPQTKPPPGIAITKCPPGPERTLGPGEAPEPEFTAKPIKKKKEEI